eukprot:GHVL01019986.1.p1 GENE.GHVL01019986.1~~GHVL01019986.1.p1  ORF type:complete len:340 (+),score=71.81 GHVL01019986.1:24-1022(+)
MAAPSRVFQLSIIVAATVKDNIIGKNNTLPWYIKDDIKRFKNITKKVINNEKKNAVIMGRKTWESLPDNARPLNGRLNIVISSTLGDKSVPNDVRIASDFENAVSIASTDGTIEECFCIGGERVYKDAMEHPLCRKIYLTRVALRVEDADAFFPEIDDKRFTVCSISKSYSYNDIAYDYITYIKSKENIEKIYEHDEYEYLNCIKNVINIGKEQKDRTNTGTLSIFGHMMRFDLTQTFPILTTKRVFWRGVVEELIWFIKGDTNANHLTEKNIKIWEANGCRQFLDARKLSHREEGDLGPVYGFQWRHFGAEYEDMHADYTSVFICYIYKHI